MCHLHLGEIACGARRLAQETSLYPGERRGRLDMREQVRLHQLQEVYRGVSRTPQRLTPVPAQAAVFGREGRDPAERVRDASVTPNAPAWFDHRILITLTDSG